MEANYQDFYRKGRNTVFVYTLTCTEEEKEQYKELKGDYYREDAGKPLYFNTYNPDAPENFRLIGDGMKGHVNFSSKGNLYIDDTEQALTNMFVETSAGAIAQELGKDRAKELKDFIMKAVQMKNKKQSVAKSVDSLEQF